MRFETIPSRPMAQACRKIAAPSPVIASLSWIPSRIALRVSKRAKRFLRFSRGPGAHFLPLDLHHVIGDQNRVGLPLPRSGPSKSNVSSERSKTASPSSTAVSTGSAATALRMHVKALE
jgi:hypothetical protein